jgi:regulatory protein
MIITKISHGEKKKVLIELDGEYAFFLYEKEIKRLRLKEGDEMKEQLAEDICQLILFPRAKEKALSLLQYRNRTKKELAQKLRLSGYPDSIIEQVIVFLEEYHFLDDEAYVRSYIEIYGKKKSRLLMQQQLSLKGIGKELFLSVWEEQADDVEQQALREQIEKRIRMKGPITYENYPKFYAYFARKGYASVMIADLLKEYRN